MRNSFVQLPVLDRLGCQLMLQLIYSAPESRLQTDLSSSYNIMALRSQILNAMTCRIRLGVS